MDWNTWKAYVRWRTAWNEAQERKIREIGDRDILKNELVHRILDNAVAKNKEIIMSDPIAVPGVHFRDLAKGDMVFITTSNTYYRVQVKGKDEFLIDGNPQNCPKPMVAKLYGSFWDMTTDVRPEFIGKGMCLLYGLPDKIALRTTPIQRVEHYIAGEDKFLTY